MTYDSTQNFVEISHISSSIQLPDLKALLECFGGVKKINMHQKATGERVCIAQLGTAEVTQGAVSLTGTKLGDRAIKVRQLDSSEVVGHFKGIGATDRTVAVEDSRLRQPVPDQGTSEADRWRDDQIQRTIYVGNLSHHITEDHVRSYFSRQGTIKFIKMSGPGMDNPYCFIEFLEAAAAQKAYALNGTPMNGRPLRIGKVQNPVGITGVKMDILNNPLKLSQAMSSARQALQLLEKKKKREDKPPVKESDRDMRRCRSRSFRRHRLRSTSSRRHRSQSPLSSSRSRSRSRRRRRRRRRSRSYSRGSRGRRSYSKGSTGPRSHSRSSRVSRTTSSSRVSSFRKQKQPKEKMVWDGFNWHPINSAEGQAMKKGEEIGASGPRVGCSPGYVFGKGFLGA